METAIATASEVQEGQASAPSATGTTETAPSTSEQAVHVAEPPVQETRKSRAKQERTTSAVPASETSAPPEKNYDELRKWSTVVSQENARLKKELEGLQRNEIADTISFKQPSNIQPKPIGDEEIYSVFPELKSSDVTEAQKESARLIIRAADLRAEQKTRELIEPIWKKSWDDGARMAIEKADRDLPEFKEIVKDTRMKSILNGLEGSHMGQYEKLELAYSKIMAERMLDERMKEKQVLEEKKKQSSSLERGGGSTQGEKVNEKPKTLLEAYRQVQSERTA